jgi:putative ABC transport system permease protein
VAEASGSAAGDDALAAARRAPEAASITRVQRTESWSWAEDSVPRESLLQLMGVEPATAAHFIPLEFDAGSIEDVRGTDVAAITGSAQQGDTLHLESPDGTRTAVRVVATIAEPTSFIKGDLLVDQAGLQLDAGDTEDTWLAEPAAGITDDELADALGKAAPSAWTMTFAAWTEDGVARSVAEQRTAILMLLGGAGLLAACSLAQSTLTSVRERRAEFRLLARIGASRRSVLGSIIGESAIIAAAAAILAAGVVALIRLRLGVVLEVQGAGVPALMPYGILVLVLLACVAVSIGSAALGGVMALWRRAGEE